MSLLLVTLAAAVPMVDLRTNLFAATYGVMRSAVDLDQAVKPGPLADGVAILRKVETSFPDRIRTRAGAEISGDAARVKGLYWRTLDAYVFMANSPSDLAEFAETAPEKIGGYLPTAKALRDVVEAIRPAFEAKAIEADGTFQTVAARLAFWKERVEPKLTPILEKAMAILGADSPPARLQVLVLPATGGREGMTVRGPGGLRIVVGAGKYEGHDFSEVVVHELLHALDASAPEKGFLAELRAALRSARKPEEEAAHAAIFTIAADLTREFLDPRHVDVGERHGAYARGLARARRAVEGPIKDLREGRIDRKRAIELIVSAVDPPAGLKEASPQAPA